MQYMRVLIWSYTNTH